MRRVVITGLGIVSCLGNDKEAVAGSLRAGKSGIRFNPSYAEMGLRSHVSGSVNLNLEELIDRKLFRFMGDAAAYAYLSMEQAIKDSGLSEEQISNPRTGLIAGSGGASTVNQMEAIDTLREKGVKRIGPYRVTRTMGSTVSACLATPFKIKGVNFSISSACATSAHCIGQAMEQIQLGKQDVVFAGGGEEEHWSQSCLFDAMGALSTQYNETPEKASRAYDAKRDGFVIAGGGGMVVVEELEHALARGADLRGNRRLRRHQRWLRHGRSERRRRDPLHAAGALHRRHPDRLPQHPRHLDSGWRRCGNQRRARRIRRQGSSHQLDQEPVRPQPRRCRRAGSDLLHADDGR